MRESKDGKSTKLSKATGLKPPGTGRLTPVQEAVFSRRVDSRNANTIKIVLNVAMWHKGESTGFGDTRNWVRFLSQVDQASQNLKCIQILSEDFVKMQVLTQ